MPGKVLSQESNRVRSNRVVDSLLPVEISIAGTAERYTRGKNHHSIHVWWARRPHAAMRALVLSAVLPRDSVSSQQVAQIAVTDDPALLRDVSANIRKCYDHIPIVLDPFSGGGTIPLEAARMGLDALSFDSNELSVFIQRSNIRAAKDIGALRLAGEVERIGKKVIQRLTDATAVLFPLRRADTENDTIFGYYWSYGLQCTSCGGEVLTLKRPWLSKKKGKQVALSLERSDEYSTNIINYSDDEGKPNTNWSKSSLICPSCGAEVRPLSVVGASDIMLATAALSPQGKVYRVTCKGAIPPRTFIKQEQKAWLTHYDLTLPTSEAPRWSGIVNPSLYGLEKHADIFNDRQRLVAIHLIGILKEEYLELNRKKGEEIAKAVIGALSGLLDQLVDWNGRLSMWIAQNEQVGRGFSGPGIAMLWDYMETDPTANGPANLWKKLDRIAAGVKDLGEIPGRFDVRQAAAQKIPLMDKSVDMVITDPPYYDNLYYSVLADFFYAWKRVLFEKIQNDLFSRDTTSKSEELVASKYRAKERCVDPHLWYTEQLSQAILEIERVLRADGIFCFVYSHSSVNGWDAILRAFRSSGFVVDSVQPLSIERKHRPRGMRSEAVNTSVTIVASRSECPKTQFAEKPVLTSFLEELRETDVKVLIDAGWAGADAAYYAFTCAVGHLSNYLRLEECDDSAAEIEWVAMETTRLVGVFKLSRRSSI